MLPCCNLSSRSHLLKCTGISLFETTVSTSSEGQCKPLTTAQGLLTTSFFSWSIVEVAQKRHNKPGVVTSLIHIKNRVLRGGLIVLPYCNLSCCSLLLKRIGISLFKKIVRTSSEGQCKRLTTAQGLFTTSFFSKSIVEVAQKCHSKPWCSSYSPAMLLCW